MRYRFNQSFNKKVKVNYNWEDNLLVKSLPIRAWTNPLSARNLISMQNILATGFRQIRRLNNWYSLWSNGDAVEKGNDTTEEI